MVKQREKHRAEVAKMILLQAHIRGINQRRGYLRMREAARGVQKRFRATQKMRTERASFLRLQKSALVIQSQYRMVRTQRQYKEKIAKVIKCQSVIKAFLLRRRFLEIKAAACLIQQRFGEFKAMRGEREEFLKKKSAALAIQSWWRMMKQRRE